MKKTIVIDIDNLSTKNQEELLDVLYHIEDNLDYECKSVSSTINYLQEILFHNDEEYEKLFGNDMAIRICKANHFSLADINVYGSTVYWINDSLNNLQDLYDINEDYVLPTKDENLINDYKKEYLEEE